MIDLLTFGCRLNILESEVMRRRAAEAGLADAVLVNSCAVTGEAVRQARQAIRRARREQPDRPVIVAGCAAQTDPDGFAAMPGVDLVLGNEEKLSADAYRDIGSAPGKKRVGDIMARSTPGHRSLDGIEGHTRAFVQVQNGCDHRCTFCVIPFGRGNSRSVPSAEVIAQVRRYVGNGYREVVLSGVDITSYGADLPERPALGALVRAVLHAVPELDRLRLSSIDSVEADEALFEAIAEEERLMPHFHLSLQAGDDIILKRMKRRHLRADAIAFTDRVRRLRPGAVFGADIIAGFPTETEAMFRNSLALVEECGLTHLHVFPFSPRPGTPAARMPQLDRGVVKERAARLRAKGEASLRRHLEGEVGRARNVLVERGGVGRTEHFTLVEMAGVGHGRLVPAHIVGVTARGLVGRPIGAA
jgi:threonylcarbamoyladenosine tRNA methylthiotransferase MtaB